MYRIYALAISLLILFATGCKERDLPPSAAEPILKGEHLLRKMVGRADTESRTSAEFFLVVGGIDTRTSSNVSLKFAWKMNDGIYAISSLPLEKIRVQLDERSGPPTIRFRWIRCYTGDVQVLMDRCVVYAIVTAREQDWPIQVNLPLNH